MIGSSSMTSIFFIVTRKVSALDLDALGIVKRVPGLRTATPKRFFAWLAELSACVRKRLLTCRLSRLVAVVMDVWKWASGFWQYGVAALTLLISIVGSG